MRIANVLRPTIANEFYRQANIMAPMLYATEIGVYPALSPIISNSMPSFIATDQIARDSHERYRLAAVELEAQITAARAYGILGPAGAAAPVAGSASAPAPAAVVPGAVAPGAAPAVAVAGGIVPGAAAALPNPLGLVGEELDDYHDMYYPERIAPVGE